MKNQKSYPDILTGRRQLGPYPMERLKRVDKPTTKITENIQRFDAREHGFSRAARGDFGDLRARSPSLGAAKDPLFPLFRTMFRGLPPVDAGS